MHDAQVFIWDETLRDGEQTPGVSLSIEQKVEIAKALDELKVDVISAGFPAVSKDEFEAVKRITSLNLNARIGLFSCGKSPKSLMSESASVYLADLPDVTLTSRWIVFYQQQIKALSQIIKIF